MEENVMLNNRSIIVSMIFAAQMLCMSAGVPDHSVIATLRGMPAAIVGMSKRSIQTISSPVWHFTRHAPYPKCKIAAVVAGVAATKAALNYKQIRALDKKRDYEHVLLGDRPESETKFYKWGLKEWGSARLIKLKSSEVMKRLETEMKTGNIRLPQFPQERPTWQDVLTAIKAEKSAFWDDIEWLEKNHVVYLECASDFFDPRGIKLDYKNACAGAPLNHHGEKALPESPGSWTEAQERYINAYMENPWWEPIKPYGSSWDFINQCAYVKDYAQNIALNIYRPLFKMVKPNYSYAAQTYWKLYTSWQRLRELEKLIQEKVAGMHHHPYVPGGVPQVIINNHR